MGAGAKLKLIVRVSFAEKVNWVERKTAKTEGKKKGGKMSETSNGNVGMHYFCCKIMNHLVRTSKIDYNEKKIYVGNETLARSKEGWKFSPTHTSHLYIVFLSQSGYLKGGALIKQEEDQASLSQTENTRLITGRIPPGFKFN